jgi:hypothetical protein
LIPKGLLPAGKIPFAMFSPDLPVDGTSEGAASFGWHFHEYPG